MEQDLDQIVNKLLQIIDYSKKEITWDHVGVQDVYLALLRLEKLLITYQDQYCVPTTPVRILYIFLRHVNGDSFITWKNILEELAIYLKRSPIYDKYINRTLHNNEIGIMFQTDEANIDQKSEKIILKDLTNVTVLRILHHSGTYEVSQNKLNLL